jgi:hypothetical protein
MFERAATALSVIALVAAAGCGRESGGNGVEIASPIVGGQSETRFPAAGFLVGRLSGEGPHAGELWRGSCGAVLIAPNAVLTAARCLQGARGVEAITGVGFGDLKTGKVYAVANEDPTSWINPAFFPPPSTPWASDHRAGIAVVRLAEAVTEIAPMRLLTTPVPVLSKALVVGYGRTTAGLWTEADQSPLDHPEQYPGLRKSAEVVVEVVRGTLLAYGASDGPEAGGVCYADDGGPLIVGDQLGGILFGHTLDESFGEFLDGIPTCRNGAGGEFGSLAFGSNPAFLRQKLAEAAAALSTAASNRSSR